MNTGTFYINRDTFFHRMNSAVKLIFFLVWSAIAFLFLDIRVFSVMLFVGIAVFVIAKIPLTKIKRLVLFVIGFNFLNSFMILLITPAYGNELAGSTHALVSFSYWTITLETLFYLLTLSLKYMTLLPVTIMFIYTTHPSQFASSLNNIGVPYKIAYSVNIALRYIPEIKNEFNMIKQAQEAKGAAFKKGEASLKQIAENYKKVSLSLVSSSLKRIDTVSNAMDLRGFGRSKKRTWFFSTPLKAADYLFFIFTILLLGTAIFLKLSMMNGFWHPFLS
ncbi:energy-coupling factor transporter transmembrane component T [Bacillus gobiensis]|uniref:energy-coupling factor transporter transmembrane component T family protein n=1 Tax=Bacillus gobiensis TaxID=1441095 RepID=UPI003D19A27B